MLSTDCLVVGAGPVGLETAALAGRAGLDVLVVDAGAVGNTIHTQFPHHTRFFSSPERLEIAGVAMPLASGEKPTGDEYLAYLRGVIQSLSIAVRTFERVIECERSDGNWIVTTETPTGVRTRVRAGSVVLATGGTQHCRTLGIDGEDLPHVHRFLGDPHRFFGRRVLVVGGRNSAVESALRLFRVGARSMLSYRGPALHERVKYWLRPEVQALIDEDKIAGFMSTVIERIGPETVELRHLDTGRIDTLQVDDVMLQLGFEQDASLLERFGVQVDPDTKAPTFDADTMETGVPGVFVVGTATAGTQQRFRVYIETSHVHGARVAAALTHRPPPDEAEFPVRILPES